MKTRIITALIAAAAWFGMLFFGSYQLSWAIMLIIGVLCAYEYFSMVLQGSDRNFTIIATACSIIPLLFIYTPNMVYLNAGMTFAALAFFGLILYGYKLTPNPFNLSLRFLFGLIYCGFLTSHIILITSLHQGAYWLLGLTAITSLSDSGAYFVGKAMGKNKLCPHISPGKTIEGFLGGIGSAVIGAIILALIFTPEINLGKITLCAVFLSILGVAGDLSESIIKRATNTKDSGQILPGHGGILDRIDSLLFCGPAFYYILYFNLL